MLIFIAINAVGALLGNKYISVIAAVAEVDKYEIRSRLLMQAMNEVGSCRPQDAAKVWAEGLKKRSAAMQYSVLSTALKQEYARQLEQTAPNWVTGVSSPWIYHYEITQIHRPDESTCLFTIKFYTATSAGPSGTYSALLTVGKENDFWRITNIAADKELLAYTGFDPAGK